MSIFFGILSTGADASLPSRAPDESGAWAAGLPCSWTTRRTARALLGWAGLVPELDRHPAVVAVPGRRDAWLLADAELVRRGRLRRALRDAGHPPVETASDVELLAQAYAAWGRPMVHRLEGAFSFAVVDASAMGVFAARDPLGERPLFWSRDEDRILVSNGLAALRALRARGAGIERIAVADFLLFGFPQEASMTFYRGISRVPPAHHLHVGARGAARVERYAALPTDELAPSADPRETIEGFRAHLVAALRARLHRPRTGIFLSGGLDSSSLAALMAEEGAPRAQAFTTVYDRLIPDEERSWSARTADSLGLPQRVFAADGHALYARPPGHRAWTVEPVDDTFPGLNIETMTAAAAWSPVVLTGTGGDPLLYPSQSYFYSLLRQGRWGNAATDAARYLVRQRRRPPLYLRTWLRHRLGDPPAPPPFPRHVLRPSLERELDLEARWRRYAGLPRWEHVRRPEAHHMLAWGYWPWLFEQEQPQVTGIPLMVRRPFFDLRLVRHALALPPFPWMVDKLILREAMRGRLPDDVRTRPKAPLAGDPAGERLRRGDRAWAAPLVGRQALLELVDPRCLEGLPERMADREGDRSGILRRLAPLGAWLVDGR